jgi:C-terminal processing protease CtpA/Prc
MKRNQLKAPFSVLILSIFIFFNACKKDVVFYDGNIKNSNYSTSDVNTWIYETMNHYYYWSDSMPLKANTNLNLPPMNYFYTLLHQYDVVDRFSWIDSSSTNLSNQLNGINTALGIKVVPFSIPNSSTDLVFVIGYVLKNSPAERAGLKRGNIIMQVGGQTITINNYSSILQGQTLTLGLGEIKNSTFSLIANGSLTVTKEVIQTNPILVDTVLDYAGKKVGYLAYTQFLSDYNNALRDAFGRYKTKQINELVIDLRYNGGGYVSASDVLSTLIVKDLSTHIGGILNTKKYNAIYGAELKKTGTESDSITRFVSEANNVGSQLNRVFILTSGNTASASELVINNLTPFMPVILIGENTYGKNVGSFTITDSKNRWSYGLQPITFQIFNSKHESNYGTVNGFTPNYYKEDNEVPYFQLGDQNETYLKIALNIISGAIAMKPNMIGAVPISAFHKAQRLSISDNPQQDRIDMWVDPKNKPAQTF